MSATPATDGPLAPAQAPARTPAAAPTQGPARAPAPAPARSAGPAARDSGAADRTPSGAAVPGASPSGAAMSGASPSGAAVPGVGAPGAAASLGVTPGTVLPDLGPVHEVTSERDLDEAVGILTGAFLDDPVITWLAPRGMPGRECYIAGFMRSWTRFMLEHEGRAVLSPQRDAVLVWEPSERAVPLTEADERAFRADVTNSSGLAAERCLGLIDLLDANCPPGLPPHAHGALAAVLPGATSRGAILRLGLELLRYVLPRKWGIYCEASSASNCAMWQRLGGAPVGRRIPLPGSDAVLTPLYISAETLASHPAVPLLL